MEALHTLYRLRQLKETDPDAFRSTLRALPHDDQLKIASHWYFTARSDQILPWHEDWYLYLIKPGRRWGKTYSGSRNVRDYILHTPNTTCICIAASFDDAQNILIKGPSGILVALEEAGYTEYDGGGPLPTNSFKVRFSGIPEVVLSNGSKILYYTAEKASKLRGQGVTLVWADELLTWFEGQQDRDRKVEEVWQQMTIICEGRILVTSTPTAIPFLKKLYERIKKDPERNRLITGSSFDNPHLTEAQRSELEAMQNTRFGRQEVHGQESFDIPGALWKWDMIHRPQGDLPEMVRTVVAVDPAVTNNAKSDETGICVVGKGANGKFYVLADYTLKGSTKEWAQKVVWAYNAHEADCIVYESNQGGDLVAESINFHQRHLPLRSVRASKGKYSRAEPIAMLYEQGKVYHAGKLDKLEEQMTEYDPAVYKGSPDRLDALVWALHHLSQGNRPAIVWS